MVFHTIGDSHCKFGFQNINDIKINHLGSKLCFSIGRDGLNILDIRKLGVKDNDTVLFSFGEIDCRCHINRQVVKFRKDYKKVIDEIIDNYIKVLNENVSFFNKLNVVLYNILPPADNTIISSARCYPFLGTNEERISYVKYFNEKLKDISDKNNFIYLDIYDCYANEKGLINKEYSDGHVHIKNEVFLRDKLIELNIL